MEDRRHRVSTADCTRQLCHESRRWKNSTSSGPRPARSLIRELATGEYLTKAQGVIFVGDPHRQKHLAIALAVAACRKDGALVLSQLPTSSTTLSKPATLAPWEMCATICSLRRPGCRRPRIFALAATRPNCSSKFSPSETSALSDRDHQLTFGEFTKVFQDKRLCAAVLDRLTHNAHIIDTGTVSQRKPLTAPRKRGRTAETQPTADAPA